MSKFPKKKFMILLTSLMVASIAWIGSYTIMSRELTEFQRKAEISFESETGSTKFKIYVDATSIAGIGFCLTAIGILVYLRIRRVR